MTQAECHLRWTKKNRDKVREYRRRYKKSFFGRLAAKRRRFKESIPPPKLSARMQAIAERVMSPAAPVKESRK